MCFCIIFVKLHFAFSLCCCTSPSSIPCSLSRPRKFPSQSVSTSVTSVPGLGGKLGLSTLLSEVKTPSALASAIVYSHSFIGNANCSSADLLYSFTEPADSKYLLVLKMLTTVAIIIPSLVSTETNCPLFTGFFSFMTKEKLVMEGESSVVIIVPSFCAADIDYSAVTEYKRI